MTLVRSGFCVVFLVVLASSAGCSNTVYFPVKSASGGAPVAREWRSCHELSSYCDRAYELAKTEHGDFPAAIAQIDEVLKKKGDSSPTYKNAAWNKAMLYEAMGDFDKAIETLHLAEVPGPNPASSEIEFCKQQRVVQFVSGPSANQWNGAWPLRCEKQMKLTITGMHDKSAKVAFSADDGCDLTLVNCSFETTGDVALMAVQGSARVTVTNSSLLATARNADAIVNSDKRAVVTVSGGAITGRVRTNNGATIKVEGAQVSPPPATSK